MWNLFPVEDSANSRPFSPEGVYPRRSIHAGGGGAGPVAAAAIERAARGRLRASPTTPNFRSRECARVGSAATAAGLRFDLQGSRQSLDDPFVWDALNLGKRNGAAGRADPRTRGRECGFLDEANAGTQHPLARADVRDNNRPGDRMVGRRI